MELWIILQKKEKANKKFPDPFLLVGFKHLKAAERLWEDNLYFWTLNSLEFLLLI